MDWGTLITQFGLGGFALYLLYKLALRLGAPVVRGHVAYLSESGKAQIANAAAATRHAEALELVVQRLDAIHTEVKHART